MAALVTLNVDTRNLVRGLEMLRKHSKSAPADALHRSLAFVVDKAKKATPSVDTGRMNAELAVMTQGLTKGGKLSKALNSRYKRHTADALGPMVPASWLIVSARANPESKYNELTGWRWVFHQIKSKRVPGGGKVYSRHPLFNHKVSEFKDIMADHVQRMISRRHSSSHFFQVSWNPLLAKLANVLPPKYRGTFKLKAGNEGRLTGDMGNVYPATPGMAVATATIENRVGMAGKNPNLDRQRNEAARRILTPILQNAVDTEWAGQVKLLVKQGIIELKASLKQYGFH